VVEEEAPSEAKVLDLMDALEASLAAAQKKGGGAKKRSSRPAKPAKSARKGA